MTKRAADLPDRIVVVNTGLEGDSRISTMSGSVAATNDGVTRYLGGWLSALVTNHGPLYFERKNQNWNHDVIYSAYTADGDFIGSLTFIDPPFTIAL